MTDKKAEEHPSEADLIKEAEEEEVEFVERDPTGRYGRYNEILGKGAFKTVYRAFDEVDGIEVAWNQVKVEDVLQSPEDLERLYSEVHLLKSLKHKNIIKLYNSWVDTKTKNVNFITEIFTSGTLRQYRKKHKHVDMRAVKNWAKQILRGLLYLHSHNPPIIHRDLKCDNIFVNGNQGEVKIGDLGLAAILRQAHAAHSVIGTPEFMAPELYEEEYNELVDIYSFGMCLLEMVTFEYPYSECTNAAQIYKKVTSGKKPAALEKVKDLEVRAFIEKCLATASKRLPARELLMDPFLQSDGDRESIDLLPPISRSTSRADDMEGLSTIKEEPSTGRPSSVDSCNRRSECSPTRDNLSQLADESKQHDHQLVTSSGASSPEQSQDSDNQAGGYQRGNSFREDGKRSRDFRVKGKKKDDDTVFLRVRIADLEGHVRNIHFPFSIEGDTAMSVASEMVAELDLSDQDVTTIAEMIDAAVVALVPDWKPGAAFEENVGGTEVDEGVKDEGVSVTQPAEEITSAEGEESDEEVPTTEVAVEGGQPIIKSRSPRTGPLSYSPRVDGASSSMHGRFEEVTYHPEGSEFAYKFGAPHNFSSGSSEVREDGDDWDLSEEVTSPVANSQGTFCLDVKTEQTPTNLLKIVEHQHIDSDGPGCNEVLVTIKSSGCGAGAEQKPSEDVDSCREDVDSRTEVSQDIGQVEAGCSEGVVTAPDASGNLSNSAEHEQSIARELKLLAMRQEQELRELQRKHESALLEIRNRCRCRRSSSLNSPQLSSPHNQNLDALSQLLDSELGFRHFTDSGGGASVSTVSFELGSNETSTAGHLLSFGSGVAGTSSSGCLPLHLQTAICKPDQGFCVFEQDNAERSLRIGDEVNRSRAVSPSSASCSNECFGDLRDFSMSKERARPVRQQLKTAGTWPSRKENGVCDFETLFDGSETFVAATCSERSEVVSSEFGMGNGKEDELSRAGGGLSDDGQAAQAQSFVAAGQAST